mmetsp:Transcript_14584/g.30544  ORF Transcript_14584/g.30544 Transcript_14584/m.30544 type:complete len:227 (+) Transcript_14584:218-898(+)
MEHHLREERVSEERRDECDAVEGQLREEVLKTGHGHEGEDQVEDHGEDRGRGVPHRVLKDHPIGRGEHPRDRRKGQGHRQRLPRHDEEREAHLGEAGAQRGHRHHSIGTSRRIRPQAPGRHGPNAAHGGGLGERRGRRRRGASLQSRDDGACLHLPQRRRPGCGDDLLKHWAGCGHAASAGAQEGGPCPKRRGKASQRGAQSHGGNGSALQCRGATGGEGQGLEGA